MTTASCSITSSAQWSWQNQIRTARKKRQRQNAHGAQQLINDQLPHLQGQFSHSDILHMLPARRLKDHGGRGMMEALMANRQLPKSGATTRRLALFGLIHGPPRPLTIGNCNRASIPVYMLFCCPLCWCLRVWRVLVLHCLISLAHCNAGIGFLHLWLPS